MPVTPVPVTHVHQGDKLWGLGVVLHPIHMICSAMQYQQIPVGGDDDVISIVSNSLLRLCKLNTIRSSCKSLARWQKPDTPHSISMTPLLLTLPYIAWPTLHSMCLPEQKCPTELVVERGDGVLFSSHVYTQRYQQISTGQMKHTSASHIM